MNVDWQAYEDGLMSKEDLAKVEALLASDPEARAELEGLRRFKSSLASLKDAEPVPIGSLRAKCIKKRDPRKFVLLIGGIAAAAAAMAWTWSSFLNPPVPDYGPVICTTKVTDPVEARSYLRLHTKLDLGALDPAPVAKITSVTASPAVAKYDLDYKGKDVRLTIQYKPLKPHGAGTVVRSGIRFLTCATFGPPEISWGNDQLDFVLTGQEMEVMWPLADDLAKKTLAWGK